MTNRPANRGVGVRSVKFAGRGGFAAGSASDPHNPAGKGRRKRANRQREAVADMTKSFNWTEDMGVQGKGGEDTQSAVVPWPGDGAGCNQEGRGERSTSIHHGSQAPKVSWFVLMVFADFFHFLINQMQKVENLPQIQVAAPSICS
jgi:hypothetical protein